MPKKRSCFSVFNWFLEMKNMVTITHCESENIKTIVDGINNYNLSQVSALGPTWTPLEFAAKDQYGKVLGGVLGGIGYWNGLEIKILWVDESFRQQGVGSKLLDHIENVAKEKGATVALLDTFDFQAEGFYKKKGYAVIGELLNFPKGHKRIYFSKEL